jgi:hypothetical protein
MKQSEILSNFLSKEKEEFYNTIKSKIDRLIKEGHSPKAVHAGIEIDHIFIGCERGLDKDFYPLTICGQKYDVYLSHKCREDLYDYLRWMLPQSDSYLDL